MNSKVVLLLSFVAGFINVADAEMAEWHDYMFTWRLEIVVSDNERRQLFDIMNQRDIALSEIVSESSELRKRGITRLASVERKLNEYDVRRRQAVANRLDFPRIKARLAEGLLLKPNDKQAILDLSTELLCISYRRQLALEKFYIDKIYDKEISSELWHEFKITTENDHAMCEHLLKEWRSSNE